MSSINQHLYEYIISHSSDITEVWFKEKRKFSGPFYSNNHNPEIDHVLREQHALTIKTIAHTFLEESTLFNEKLLIWGESVAQSRIDYNAPIHDVLEALSKTRAVIWTYVERFINLQTESVTLKQILNWSSLFNSNFDQLIHHFTERYYVLSRNQLAAQQLLITELSTPVIPLLDGVAVLPIVGDIDAYRAKTFLEIVPQKCSEMEINKLFIDVSGVLIMDTRVANEMFKLIQILSLLGIETYISGISPEVAQTSIQLGHNWSDVPTYSTLKQALAKN